VVWIEWVGGRGQDISLDNFFRGGRKRSTENTEKKRGHGGGGNGFDGILRLRLGMTNKVTGSQRKKAKHREEERTRRVWQRGSMGSFGCAVDDERKTSKGNDRSRFLGFASE
jgi:hypothetical protein